MGDTIVKAELDSYDAVLCEYSRKLQDATPVLIEEYNKSVKTNRGGLQGLASLYDEKVSALAKISNEGIDKMIDVYHYQGSGSYEDYCEWASKLLNVYMEESAKVQDAYMKSAQ